MENKINDKIKVAMQRVVDDELTLLKSFEGGLYAGEYEKLVVMTSLTTKRAFLEGYKTGVEAMDVVFLEKDKAPN